MNGTLFYIFGITLVVSALVVSLVGLRIETFPPTRGALAGVVIYFAVLVGATTTFAVLHAADDQHARQAAEAQAATPAGGAATTAPSSTTTSTASTTSAPAATALKLSAPSSGTPAYNTDKLSAKTGQVTIDFSNPSPVQHDVAIAQGSKIIAQSDLISGGSTSVSTSLVKPGKYLYYCTVPGHRQAGMQGTLTVK
jgi:plastocyanin